MSPTNDEVELRRNWSMENLGRSNALSGLHMMEILGKEAWRCHVQGKRPTVRRARFLTCRTRWSRSREEAIGGSLGKEDEHGWSMGRGSFYLEPRVVGVLSEL